MRGMLMNRRMLRICSCFLLCSVLLRLSLAQATDRLYVMYTARVMSQAYPWIAQETGLFKKYDLNIPLVFVTPGAPTVATILSGVRVISQRGAVRWTRHF